MKTTRDLFRGWVLGQAGRPYIWGGKGPEGFDCSGLITAALFGLGLVDIRQTHNSAKLYDDLEPIETAQPGDLVFYGSPENISHVMIFWGDGRVYGATGGNRDTQTLADARAIGARVRFKESVSYRPDFRGFRKLPLASNEIGDGEVTPIN